MGTIRKELMVILYEHACLGEFLVDTYPLENKWDRNSSLRTPYRLRNVPPVTGDWYSKNKYSTVLFLPTAFFICATLLSSTVPETSTWFLLPYFFNRSEIWESGTGIQITCNYTYLGISCSRDILSNNKTLFYIQICWTLWLERGIQHSTVNR